VKKRIFHLLLALCMALSLMPNAASAENLLDEVSSGESVTKADIDRLVVSGKSLKINGGDGVKLVFDTEALKEIAKQTSEYIKVAIEDVTAEYQHSRAGKKVFFLAVFAEDKTVYNFKGKAAVTLPYEPNEGENAENVTVWYLTNSGIAIEIPIEYDAETNFITFEVTHFLLYMVGIDGYINPFEDVGENDWYYMDVKAVKQNNLFVGTDLTTFSPDSTMTREMLWTVLGRVDGSQKLYGEGAFESAREWAMGAGITDGKSPKGYITREQIATMLWRYAGKPDAGCNLSRFSDAVNISDYARDAMAWAVENGIILGYDGALMPKDCATRAEAAAIMRRFIEVAIK